MGNAEAIEQKLKGTIIYLTDGRKEVIQELESFEPEDRSVGIFGDYIEVVTHQGNHFVLNELGTVHEVELDENGDWESVVWTRSVGRWEPSLLYPDEDYFYTVEQEELDGTIAGMSKALVVGVVVLCSGAVTLAIIAAAIIIAFF